MRSYSYIQQDIFSESSHMNYHISHTLSFILHIYKDLRRVELLSRITHLLNLTNGIILATYMTIIKAYNS